MQNRKTIFFIGLIIFLLPILGFPRGFVSFMEVVCGIILMFLGARKSIEKRIVREKRTRKRKEKNPIFVESNVVSDNSPISATINEVSEPETMRED